MIPIDPAWLAAHPLPQPGEDTDKNRRGRVLAAGGSRMVPGALLLTGEAAFRAGAGKVQLATVAEGAQALGMRFPEAAVHGLPANGDGELGTDAGERLASMLGQCDAAVVGPGMGPHAGAVAILRSMLDHSASEPALLLDAAMIGAAPGLKEAIGAWEGRLVLTPHPGEMAALMGCDEADATPELAEAAAVRFGATVVLKKSETWIAVPGEPLLYYPGGGPGLATGGSGDVLAGVIAGLLARGAPTRIAAAWGVWLHGEAGKSLARRAGTLGFLARELLPEIPRLLSQPDAATLTEPSSEGVGG